MRTTADRVRNRRGEGSRLRAEIVRGGAELLDETGQEQSVTLRAVARRVGITAPSIYGHFPNRESILLAVVRQAFAELTEQLQAAQAAAGRDPEARLRAVSDAYLHYARLRPQRYRVMFGGVWDVTDAVRAAAASEAEAAALGQDALAVIVGALRDCAAAGCSASTDPFADAVALWVALHGLAHQQAVIPHFPWPAGIAERLVARVALLSARPMA
jgi:AcrR family transcriptional regulator